MKGFKPTGYGPKSGFDFSAAKGFTGSTGGVTNVGPYTRRKGYAKGGFVKEGYQPKVERVGDSGHATTYRNKPATNLDQETGGKTPLRPGFKSGGKNWIQDAVKKPGALHKALGVPEGKKIPEKKLAKAANSDSPKMRQRANFAKTMATMNKADGGKVAAIKSSADALFKVYSKSGNKMVGTAKTREGAKRMMDRRNAAQGSYDHYVEKPDGTKNFADGGKVGAFKAAFSKLVGKIKPAQASAQAAPTSAPAEVARNFILKDRRTGTETPYIYKALRDAALERKNKEMAGRYESIDRLPKSRGGAAKMRRC